MKFTLVVRHQAENVSKPPSPELRENCRISTPQNCSWLICRRPAPLAWPVSFEIQQAGYAQEHAGQERISLMASMCAFGQPRAIIASADNPNKQILMTAEWGEGYCHGVKGEAHSCNQASNGIRMMKSKFHCCCC